MKNVFVLLALYLFAFSAQAQTILISDVDDTIRPQYVKDLSDSAKYVFDNKSHFMGMNILYHSLVRDNQGLRVFYVSKAPEWLMGHTHRDSLKHGHFPAGVYFPRTVNPGKTHKLITISEIIERTHPTDVIMLGDNGEADPDVYNRIAMTYPGIRFHQFIRDVYLTEKYDGEGSDLHNGQQFFVTPVEVALELRNAGLLKESSIAALVKQLVPKIVQEKGRPKKGEMAFPYFVRCQDFVWSWDNEISVYPSLQELKAKINRRCHNQ